MTKQATGYRHLEKLIKEFENMRTKSVHTNIIAKDWKKLAINGMPSLTRVCVWEMPFPVQAYTTGSPNTGATNESGFNTLPGGRRNAYFKDFQGFRGSAYFWASEARSAMGVSYNSTGYVHYSMSGTDGISVRCVKD